MNDCHITVAGDQSTNKDLLKFYKSDHQYNEIFVNF